MYQADQIQSMINELDRVLRRTGHWRIWTLFTQLHDQRQMIERVRSFLLMQQRSEHRTAPPELSPIAPHPAPALIRPLPPPHLHPDSVKLEVVALIAQRDALREEVKFLSALTQTPDPKPPASNPASAPMSAPMSDSDTRQVEQLSALHDRTDFLLSSMDSSLQLAFSSMQKNVEVYQTTLHHGLDRMHNLGYQGEVLFSALINHLAQQMGRELAANPTANPIASPTANLTANLTTNFTTSLPDRPNPIQSPFSALTSEAFHPPETEPPAEPRPETAVQFSPETAVSDREMTLETLFGNPFDETSSDIFGETFGETFEVNKVNDDITLEEMNELFADVPSLK